MTRTSIREPAAALHGRYVQASKVGKGRLLDEFCQITGYHQSPRSSYWVIRPGPPASAADAPKNTARSWPRPSKRPGGYGTRLLQASRSVLPELVPILERCHVLHLSEDIRTQLLQVSASIVYWLLFVGAASGLA